MRRFLCGCVLTLGLMASPSAFASPTITSVTVTKGVPTITWTNVPGETVARLEIGSSPDATPIGFFPEEGDFVNLVAYASDTNDASFGKTSTTWTPTAFDTGFSSRLNAGIYYAHVEDVAPIPFGCALATPPTCPLNDWSPVVKFQVTNGTASPPPKHAPDTVNVNAVIEGGAHKWIKVDATYLFGDYIECGAANADTDPDCDAPSFDLTVTRVSHVRKKIGKKRFRTVTTRAVVYEFSDDGINDGVGGDFVIPPLVPGVDFTGGARNGTYTVKLRATFALDTATDTSTFSISNGRIY